ncbi:MAG TPA: FHA domain-containing protein, partial [Planctomycetota bacterium]|nr:FHA domain-containing protein [Planctomycetota bacterium]
MARIIISDGTTRREVELVDAVSVAGRSSDNKIHIDDKQASRRHFQIEKTDFGYKLVDLESRNGSRVNDRIVNQALLRPGDRIVVGKHTMTFEDAHF